jgi:hypothetical protein
LRIAPLLDPKSNDVIAGLDPAIQGWCGGGLDARVKPGHDKKIMAFTRFAGEP